MRLVFKCLVFFAIQLSFRIGCAECSLPLADIQSYSKVPNRVLGLYNEKQYLGIAVVDHETFPGFRLLRHLIESIGHSKNIKTIVVEDSAVYADIYAKMSLEDPESFKEEVAHIRKTKQFYEIYENILPLVRWINTTRKEDPLLVVPIDSMGAETASMQMFYGDKVFPDEMAHHFVDTTSYQFVMSINREKLTADNFKTMVEEKYPGKKGLIVYHAAHILNQVYAVGYEVVGHTTYIKKDHLGWMGFAVSNNHLLEMKYGKVLVDTVSSANPLGVLCWPDALLAKLSTSPMWYGGEASVNTFKNDSFFTRYREGSVSVTGKSIADFYLLAH